MDGMTVEYEKTKHQVRSSLEHALAFLEANELEEVRQEIELSAKLLTHLKSISDGGSS